MTEICKAGIEKMKPKLIEGATVTKFASDIHFVQFEGRFVKIDDAENELMQDFNGFITLADIISKHLSKGDTGVFNRLLSLITRLNKAKLFDKECESVLKGVSKPEKILQGCKKKIGTLLPKGLCAFKGKIISSIPGIIFLAVISSASLYFPQLKGLNILKELTYGSLAPEYAYLAALFFIWITVSFIISGISLSSAAALTSLGISAPVNAVFKYGIFYLSVSPVPVVSKGRKEAVKHYIMLILVPFSIAGVAAILWQFGIFRPAMAIVYVTAFSIGLWRVSPLIKSPFTMLAGFFVQGEGSTSTFLRRRFVKDLLTTKKNSAETDRLILLSTLGLVWLYGIYEYFWHVANSTLSYLLADTLSASGITFILISISLIFIVLPVLLLATGALIVVLGNIGSVTATPLARMRRLADIITSKTVPAKAQIVAFLAQIPLFSGLNETELAALCSYIRLIKYGSKRRIIRQGDTGECFYTIVSGTAEVVVENASGVEKVVEHLSTGDSFGEIALIEKIPRTASIVTKTPVTIFEMDKSSFDKFVISSAGGKEKVTNMIRLGKLLIAAPLFSFMSPRQISSVIMRLKTENAVAGTLFFDQGDSGDKFYFIKEGSVHIRRTEAGKIVLEKQLGQGEFFGEMALVREIPRTAKATAISDCVVATLTKEEFLEIMGHSIFSGKELDAMMRERISQLGKEALKSCL